MAKNYNESYYLEGSDIYHLIENYRQAYLKKHPNHFTSLQDIRFWQTDKNELIFYAGEQFLGDSNFESKSQPLGRNLHQASLDLTARFLALEIPEFEFNGLKIILLNNFDRGHWTSVVLQIDDIDKQKYKEIYERYQQFKTYLKQYHPELDLKPVDIQGCTNIFVQYVMANRYGHMEKIANNPGQVEQLMRAFFESINRKELLELKNKSDETGYAEGDLKLVLSSTQPAGVSLYHFDSNFSASCDRRAQSACERFLKANNINYASAENVPQQTGATCGEHAVLNALRYVFLGSTHAVSSPDLRTATNHFCPELAQLFLFDYNHETYKSDYERILKNQIEKEYLQEKESPAQNSIKQEVLLSESKNNSEAATFLSIGILLGTLVSLFSGQVLAPFLGVTSTLSVAVLTLMAGVLSALFALMMLDDSEERNLLDEKSEEQILLEAQSIVSLNKENTAINRPAATIDASLKTYTPALDSVVVEGQNNLVSETLKETIKKNESSKLTS